jgi:sarcosine oxidase subunit delta
MLLLTCFCCGVVSEETEFQCGGEAHLERAYGDCSDEEFAEYLFYRKNPKGVHCEMWRHAFGCGKWFHVVRCTMTNRIFGCYSIKDKSAPEQIMAIAEGKKVGNVG